MSSLLVKFAPKLWSNVLFPDLTGFLLLDILKYIENNNESEDAFCETKEYVWRQNKDYVGEATW